MVEYNVTTFEDFRTCVHTNFKVGTFFRGLKNVENYKLKPSAGRVLGEEFNDRDFTRLVAHEEDALMGEFKFQVRL